MYGMESSLDKSNVSDFSLSVDITNLSPVSDLAVNLSGLVTSVAGTPIRRISWSNPLPGGDKMGMKIDNISSPLDSPMFQILKSNSQIKSINERQENESSPINKENVAFFKETSFNLSPTVKEKDLNPSNSQESGYRSFSSKMWRAKSSLFSSNSCNKSSFASICGDDSLDDIFLLDTSGDSLENTAFSENISNLLTKPLVDSNRSESTKSEMKRGKLPIRRSLSMEMTSEVNELFNENFCSSSLNMSGESNLAITKIIKKVKPAFKRPDPPNDLDFHSKRRKSSPCVDISEDLSYNQNYKFKRSYSETAATIMHAILKSDLQPDLIGDGSRSFALPIIKGRHHDLKSITTETLAHLLSGYFKEKVTNFLVVDCRYPYEFEGGHIQGAKNMFSKDEIAKTFFNDNMTKEKCIVIFHCEFSSERAPNLCRFMRNKDRELNQGNYPHLHYPEMYILEGGYKAFFESYKEYCEPQNYKPMNHKDHGFELRHFRAKSKSLGADSKSRVQFRSNSIVSNI